MSYRLLDGQRYDETVVPYRPSRTYRKYLRDIIKKQKHLPNILSVFIGLIAASLLFPGWSILGGILLGLAFIGAVVLPLIPIVHGWGKPTHVGISPKGVRLYSLHWYGDNVTKPIPWSSVAGVMLETHPSVLGPVETVEFLDSKTSGGKVLSLTLDGIAPGEHRKRLLAAIKQHLSFEQIDVALQDKLNPVRLSSHTQMWLDVLSSSPKRLVDNHLRRGFLVGNGRYRIVEQIGIGGQAVAYVAEQLSEDKKAELINVVVLKEFVLPAEASLRVSRRAFESIEKEAELLSKVSHPRVVGLLDLFVDDQRAYMVLERVPGKNLRQVIKERGSIGERDLIKLALQMCEILKHLHGLDPPVIHRDFTPDNLIFSPETGVKLIDFNVAQQYEASATRTVVGKHSYLPPEQFRGRACPQSDLYALGATLYYLLTGEDPEPITVAHPIKKMPMVSRGIDNIIAKCTEQGLAERYQSAEQIAADLIALKNQSVLEEGAHEAPLP
jgi:hypothetical protein